MTRTNSQANGHAKGPKQGVLLPLHDAVSGNGAVGMVTSRPVAHSAKSGHVLRILPLPLDVLRKQGVQVTRLGSLAPEERETSIEWIESEKAATIVTPDISLQKRIERAGFRPTAVSVFSEGTIRLYNVPKVRVRIEISKGR